MNKLLFLCIFLLTSCSSMRQFEWEYFKFEEHPLSFKVPTTKTWERDIGNPCGRKECRYIARDHELGVELHLVEFKDFPEDPEQVLESVLNRYRVRTDRQVKWSGKSKGKHGPAVSQQIATQGLWSGRPWNVLAKSFVYDNTNHVVLLLYKGRLNEGRLFLFANMIDLPEVPGKKLMQN